jgi:hypothetical protein
MKKYFLIVTIFYTSINFGQSLSDLINFKTMSLNQIEEKLILEDWRFKSNESKQKESSTNKTGIISKLSAAISKTYNSVTYTYLDYLGDITTITIRDYADEDKNDVKIVSKNNLFYKNTLENLVNSNFRVTNEKSPFAFYYFPLYKVGEIVDIETNDKVYKQGNHEVHLLIFRKAEVISENRDEGTFRHTEPIDEYQIIIN